jgi:hypothetical protein
MSEDNKEKNEYVARKDLEEQTEIIISAVDAIMEKRTKEVRDELYVVRDELKADIKGVRDELYIVRDELKSEINSVQSLIDGYVKAQEDFKQEFVIMKEEMKQMKQIFKDKFGVEIKAI